MTDKASYALLHGFGNVAIALAIGYVFYKLIRTKDTPTKVSDYGRNWLAWMVLIATMAGLPNVIMKPSPDTIFKFIAPLVIFSLIAFVFGLIYGKFKLPKKALNNSSVEVEKQLNTPVDNQTSGSGINCSSCGAEITPKGAKFCGRCGAKFEPPKISNVNTDSGIKTKTVSQNISSSSTSKAETVRPPTIEKKIVDEIQPEKIPSENQEKKTGKTAVYINEKPINNRPGNGPGPGVQKNTKNNLILLFIFTALFFLVFSGDKNTKDTSAADKNTLIDSTKDKSITYGTVAYANGDVYTGQLKNGRPTWEKGHYKVISGPPSTVKSTGKTSSSKGVTTMSNGDIYKGELKDGIRYGKGLYTWKNGDTYDGEWKDGIRYGKGLYTWKNGDTYDGEWKDGRRHGQGIQINGGRSFIYKSYNGKWKDGGEHGVGVITLFNGYSGIVRFKNGQKIEDL